MANFIVCIKCNNTYDAKDVKRDFRYRSSGKPFDKCVYCRGLRMPMHMTCDICNKLRTHYDYIRVIKKLAIIILRVPIVWARQNVKDLHVLILIRLIITCFDRSNNDLIFENIFYSIIHLSVI